MTTNITPQEAQDLLDIWEDDESGLLSNTADATQNYGTLFGAAPRLAATIAADTIEYGVHIAFPDQQFMYSFDARTKWTTDKARAEHDLAGLRENEQRYEAKIRLVARRVSPTWEVSNADL